MSEFLRRSEEMGPWSYLTKGYISAKGSVSEWFLTGTYYSRVPTTRDVWKHRGATETRACLSFAARVSYYVLAD